MLSINKLGFLIAPIVALAVVGCASSPNNHVTNVKYVDFPEPGVLTTVYHGEKMVMQGAVIDDTFLMVPHSVTGVLYSIPSGYYHLRGDDDNELFFHPYTLDGKLVTRSILADPFDALAVYKKELNDPEREVCVATISGNACYDSLYQVSKRKVAVKDQVQKSIIFQGLENGVGKFLYQELLDDKVMRNENFKVDLNASNRLRYGGVDIEIKSFTDDSISYVVNSNFKRDESVITVEDPALVIQAE